MERSFPAASGGNIAGLWGSVMPRHGAKGRERRDEKGKKATQKPVRLWWLRGESTIENP